jgi:hypothetical protein
MRRIFKKTKQITLDDFTEFEILIKSQILMRSLEVYSPTNHK